MPKFIFFCRGCRKKIKQTAKTLQDAKAKVCLANGGIKLDEDQGYLCGKCYQKQTEDFYDDWTITEGKDD